MSTKKTFESFVNSMNENVDLYKVYKKVSGKYSLRKPSYWGDLFNQRASIPYRELTKYDKELHSLDVYTTKELGCHNEYPLQSNFKVQVPQVFVLYCNTESGELGEYYGMSILVNTEGATYPRYACGMPDFEPELHNFVNGIPESYLNIVTAGAQLLHEQMIVEGQFSWLTYDTNTQIGSERQNMITVFMYDNMGNKWTEKDYEGYGSFGGMDYYDLVATMNGYTEEDVKTMKGSFKELRQLGIDLAFGKIKTKDKKKKTLFPALVEDPRFNWKRHDFTQEAESDPNQSWYQEEESDDDYDDDYENGWYESKVTEAKKLTIKDVEKAWDFSYGEDFEYEYGSVYVEIMGKYKGKITKDELAKIWDDKYGEDLQSEHGGFFDKLDENLNEATVVMDAMDPKSKILKKLLKKHKVTMKVLDPSGPSGWPEVELTGSREDLQSVLADPNGWDDPELGEYIEESNILEARSINKISKEFGETVNKMKDIVKIYIAAEDGSDEKATTRQQLIDLTKKKKALTNELDDAVAGKNKDVKLVITEGVMSDIHQMIGNHKSFDTFQKEFFKEYGHKKVMKKTPEFLQWLKALYNDFEYTSGEAIEEKYTKKSLLKKLGDADDAMIQTGNGKEYIIYNPDSNNDDNAEMWHAKSVFAVDQDGEEHEIAYKDIGLVMVESVVNEALSKEQKMVETFLNKIAKEFDYSIQDAVRFVKETISKMGLDESIVTEKKEEKDEAAEIEAEIEKLTKENKYGYAKDIKRLKVRLSAVNMMKKFNKNNESVVTEGSSKEFEEALAHYAEIGGHSDNGRGDLVDAYWKLLNKKQRDEYFMPLAHAQYAKNHKVGWAKEVTEHHSENPNDKYEVRHCDKPETPYGVWEGDTLVKCFELEEDAFAFAKEQNKEQGLSENRELMAIDSYLNTKDEEVLIDFLDDAYGNSDDRKTRKEWEDARKDAGYNELIDFAVAHAENFGMDLQDIEDAIEVYEAKTINEKDDAGTHLDNLADLVGKAKDFFAIGKELKSGKYKYDYSDSMMPMYTIKADGFKFAILNKRYVDGGDREVGEIAIGLMESVNERRSGQNSDDALILIQQALQGMKNMKAEIKGDTVIIHNKAKDEFTYSLNDGGDVQEFIDELEESVVEVTLDSLVEKFALDTEVNEDIRGDVKKFIKDNKEVLNDLADQDLWDEMYQKLYDEFGVDADSIKAKDLLKTFQFVF
jgi:hypothetical protein